MRPNFQPNETALFLRLSYTPAPRPAPGLVSSLRINFMAPAPLILQAALP